MLPLNRPLRPAEIHTPDSNSKNKLDKGKTDRSSKNLLSDGNCTLNSGKYLESVPDKDSTLDQQIGVTVQTKADHAGIKTDHFRF